MINKILSFSIILSIAACILCAPLQIFVQDFCSNSTAFSSAGAAGFSNILFTGGKSGKLNGFTDNIKTKKYNNVLDFSNVSALIPTAKYDLPLLSLEKSKNIKNTVEKSVALDLLTLDRLRTCIGQNTIPFFIFFILLYIGMLRAVYLNNKNFIINRKTPVLFRTGVFHFRGHHEN